MRIWTCSNFLNWIFDSFDEQMMATLTYSQLKINFCSTLIFQLLLTGCKKLPLVNLFVLPDQTVSYGDDLLVCNVIFFRKERMRHKPKQDCVWEANKNIMMVICNKFVIIYLCNKLKKLKPYIYILKHHKPNWKTKNKNIE